MNSLDNFKVIKEKVYKLQSKSNLIIVTKNRSFETILPIIQNGHLHFGENKVQEAKEKWSTFLNDNKNVKLHLIGKLQSNKAKDAFALFDFIHTLDSEKLALTINKTLEKNTFNNNEKNLLNQSEKSSKNLEIFIQVNIGDEPQKFGIPVNQTDEFIKFCQKDLMLNIIGLMAIPPANELPSPYFALLKKINDQNNFKKISMGMSSDYLQAIALGSTDIRLGTAIFGERK